MAQREGAQRFPQHPARHVADRARRDRSGPSGGTPRSSPGARIGTRCSATARPGCRSKNRRSSTTNASNSATSRTTGKPRPSGRTCRRKHGSSSRTKAFSG
jgi:hypothetical protein